MQTCSRCGKQAPDTTQTCPTCQSDLREFSTTAIALRQFQENPRVISVHLAVGGTACPVCQSYAGTYPKDQVPRLPIEGCSNPNGCNCFYQPMLKEIFP